jgi:hypothetical protein
MLMGGYFIGHH